MTKTGDAIKDARQWAKEWRHEADLAARGPKPERAVNFKFAAVALEEFAAHLEDQLRTVAK